MGEYYEKTGDLILALQQYKLGFSKLGEDILNISDFHEDNDRVKNKILTLGYVLSRYLSV